MGWAALEHWVRTSRVALGANAGQKALTLKRAALVSVAPTKPFTVARDGFSLDALCVVWYRVCQRFAAVLASTISNRAVLAS